MEEKAKRERERSWIMDDFIDVADTNAQANHGVAEARLTDTGMYGSDMYQVHPQKRAKKAKAPLNSSHRRVAPVQHCNALGSRPPRERLLSGSRSSSALMPPARVSSGRRSPVADADEQQVKPPRAARITAHGRK